MPYLDGTPLSIPAQRRLRPSWIARSKGLPESYPTRRQASSEVTLGRNAEAEAAYAAVVQAEPASREAHTRLAEVRSASPQAAA